MASRKIPAVLLALAIFWAPGFSEEGGARAAFAQEQSEDEASGEKKLSRIEARAAKRRARIEERYEASGELEICVPMTRLRQSIILDDQTIFFESIGRRGYMNRLPNKCIGLLREERFAYANSFGQLCRGEIITVLDNFGRAWGSCSLGEFEEYNKKPKDDSQN